MTATTSNETLSKATEILTGLMDPLTERPYWLAHQVSAALVCTARTISWLAGFATSCMCTGSPPTGAVIVWISNQETPALPVVAPEIPPMTIEFSQPAPPVVEHFELVCMSA